MGGLGETRSAWVHLVRSLRPSPKCNPLSARGSVIYGRPRAWGPAEGVRRHRPIGHSEVTSRRSECRGDLCEVVIAKAESRLNAGRKHGFQSAWGGEDWRWSVAAARSGAQASEEKGIGTCFLIPFGYGRRVLLGGGALFFAQSYDVVIHDGRVIDPGSNRDGFRTRIPGR